MVDHGVIPAKHCENKHRCKGLSRDGGLQGLSALLSFLLRMLCLKEKAINLSFTFPD